MTAFYLIMTYFCFDYRISYIDMGEIREVPWIWGENNRSFRAAGSALSAG